MRSYLVQTTAGTGESRTQEIHRIPAKDPTDACRLAVRRHPAAGSARVLESRNGRRHPLEPMPDWWDGYLRGRAEQAQVDATHAAVIGFDPVAVLRGSRRNGKNTAARMLETDRLLRGEKRRSRSGREPLA